MTSEKVSMKYMKKVMRLRGKLDVDYWWEIWLLNGRIFGVGIGKEYWW